MARNIDCVNDLPKWFDKNSYQATENFSAIEWYEQIEYRKYLTTLLKIQQNRPDLHETTATTYTKYIGCIRGVRIEEAHIPGFFGNLGLLQHLADEKQGVISLTFRHLQEHASNIPTYWSDPEKWFTDRSMVCGAETHTPKTDDPLYFGDIYPLHENVKYALVRVNLDLPDKILRDGFDEWLAKTRAASGHKQERTRNRPPYDRWTRYGLLPFLDLLIWQLETGIHIPDRVMAAAISTHDRGEQSLRNTLAPLVAEIMGDTTSLLALAIDEASTIKP